MEAFFVIIAAAVIYGIYAVLSGLDDANKKKRGIQQKEEFKGRLIAERNQKKELFLAKLNNPFTRATDDTVPKFIFVDFETTDLPMDYEIPPFVTSLYPYIAQAGCLVFNEHGELIDQYAATVCIPEDAKFSPGAAKVNRLTKEICAGGKPIGDFFDFLSRYMRVGVYLVAHNIKFDHYMLKLEAKRNKVKLAKMKTFCTMEKLKSEVGIPREYGSGYKFPNLKELVAYTFFDSADINIDNTHDASVDVKLCALCFFKLKANQDCE